MKIEFEGPKSKLTFADYNSHQSNYDYVKLKYDLVINPTPEHSFGTKNFLKFFHLENFSTSYHSLWGLLHSKG